MSSLWLDVRYALRMMLRTPGFTTALILTLAIGIGASTTIFSVVNSVVLRPLPYDRPASLVTIYGELAGKIALPRSGMSKPAYFDLERSCRSCAAVAAWQAAAVSIAGGDRPVRVKAASVTSSLLPLLGVRPILGRWFDRSEDHPGDPTVVVLGFDLWRRAFGGDPSIVGKQIRVDTVPVTVVGVMPRGFQFPEREEAWLPAGFEDRKSDVASFPLGVIARLAPGSSLGALRAELAGQATTWNEWLNTMIAQVNLPPIELRIHAVPLQADIVGSLATTLWLLQGAVLCVLLISVVNVANLLLARAEDRKREVAVRHALGASRRRLVRQFVTESLLLGLCGGGLGILIAMWGVDGVAALIPRTAPRAQEIALDATAIAYAAACAAGAALVFGLAPILHAHRTQLHVALKESARMTSSKARLRVRRVLVIGEISLAVVLVVGCVMMVRGFLALQRVELGFAPDHVLSFGISLPRKSYSFQGAEAFWHRLDDRLHALPGVPSATMVTALPPSSMRTVDAIAFPGRSASDPSESDWVTDFVQIAGPDLVDTLGAHVVRGRGLARSDAAGAPPVALINETFAAKFFRDREPIGQRIRLLQDNQPEVTVVGVIRDIKLAGIDQPAGTQLILALWQYRVLWQTTHPPTDLYGIVRSTGDPADLIPAVVRAVAEIDPELAVFDVRTMDDLLWEAVARPRFLVFLLASFAGIALLLAAVGIYGVMAQTVAQRTHEIGLRVALGAQPAQVRAMVLRQAARLVGVGVVLGLAAAVVLAEVLGASLRGVFYAEHLAHPFVLAGVALAVSAVALVATWIPARRATKVEPTVALRNE